MKHSALSVTCAVILFILVLNPQVSSVKAQNNSQAVNRAVTIAVNVVFVGFDSNHLQKDYLSWTNPATRYPLIEIPGVSTGTTFSINYAYSFASQDFMNEFTSYLNSVAKVEKRTNVLWNESYSKIQNQYFLNYTHYPVNATNTYYPADQVESWLLNHSQDFGGFASTSYTLMIADLSKQLPSLTAEQFKALGSRRPLALTPHFYNKTYTDHDFGIQLNRRYMTAWGGHSRFFFIDLSAGPGSAAEQFPLQLAASMNQMSTASPYWSTWLTQYIGDYVTGAVYNIFVPDFIYPLNYAQTYRLKIFVLDNRSTPLPTIESALDPSEIRAQLSSLVPFANVEVEVKFLRLADYPDLFSVVKSATSPSLVGLTPIVDARRIYNWLSESGQGNIAKFATVTRDQSSYDIPIFVFAFQGDYDFGFTYKELVAKDVDFDRTIWGVALYDLVLISHSADDFEREKFISKGRTASGFGFTNTVIHETGHMLGLMHPFQTSYDPTENFVASVMAYYPYEDSFSQFDKDALLRGYADQFIRGATQLLKSTRFDVINSGDINSAQSTLGDAEAAYSAMNYTTAAEDSFAAYASASKANLLGGGSALSGQSLVLAVGVFSFLVGALVVYVVIRRRTTSRSAVSATRCSVCRGDLTWIQQYQRWYCYRCQRYE
jgi:hypothetical protein